ncbi:MAG: hypothetical protein M3020_26795 [Myxococcota bacterium]|nr:hypothetical protein [Myxococcota bacterium]
MKTNRLDTRAVLGAYVALAIVAGSLAAACGDDADGDDPNVIPSTGGKSGSGGEGGGGEANCEPQGEYNCYPCAPKTDEQYLNQCSDAECSPFDNAARIPGFTGTLPDL